MDDTNWESVMNALIDFLNNNNNFQIIHKFDTWTILKKY